MCKLITVISMKLSFCRSCKYDCINNRHQMCFFSIWNHHECLSWLFPLYLNTYSMGLRPLYISDFFSVGTPPKTRLEPIQRRCRHKIICPIIWAVCNPFNPAQCFSLPASRSAAKSQFWDTPSRVDPDDKSATQSPNPRIIPTFCRCALSQRTVTAYFSSK